MQGAGPNFLEVVGQGEGPEADGHQEAGQGSDQQSDPHRHARWSAPYPLSRPNRWTPVTRAATTATIMISV